MDDLTDRELIARFQAGDEAAFGELVSRYRRPLYQVARGILRSHERADEAVQDAFVKAWHGLASFRGDSSFKTWIYRIAMNASHDVRTRERSRAAVAEQLAREPEAVAPTASRPRPLEAMIREQEAARVRQAVEQLPERQRLTLTLRVQQGLKYQEIAQALGCPVGTVKANLHHAVENLKKLLGVTAPALLPGRAEEGAGAPLPEPRSSAR